MLDEGGEVPGAGCIPGSGVLDIGFLKRSELTLVRSGPGVTFEPSLRERSATGSRNDAALTAGAAVSSSCLKRTPRDGRGRMGHNVPTSSRPKVQSKAQA